MWKTVCFRLRLAGETTANFNNVRSNFSSTGPCIEKTTRGDDSIGSPIRRYKGNRYVGQPIAGPSTPKPKLKADVEFPMVFKYHQQRRRQQNGPYEWPLYKYTAGFLTSICVGQLVCLYSRRQQIENGWAQVDQALRIRRLHQIISGDDDEYAKSEHQKSYVPLHEQIDDAPSIVSRPWAVPISHDHKVGRQEHVQEHVSPVATQALKAKDADDAVDELMRTVGHIEFALGIANLAADRLKAAVPHFKSATVHRHPEATFNLGVCYELGWGVDKNKKTAMECYRAAANLGHTKAMYNLGVFYARGDGGLPKNAKAAKACFEAASKRGLADAKKMLKSKQRAQLDVDTSTLKTPHPISVKPATYGM